ncbi:hypothetical protein B0H63DRAFT_64174 [Podospora didyma]|uniref:Zn(2)-C6 fungal-type domain-containing protein n=1 Tax=Podospora didyma TaxID=330526 RepID=A0AAE0P871_9PEZI|nr:hypothetical protein B0H63DRAFT_64174 [Podospora didyma]
MSQAQQRAEAAEARRRKVRKGTHSCWECRRRKIRCQFGPGDDSVCLPCQTRGSPCRSQEYVDESRPQQQPDRRMAQRLGRLEELMSRLVDRILPDSLNSSTQSPSSALPARPRASSPTPSHDTVTDDDGGAAYRQTLDVLEASVGDETPVGLLLSLRNRGGGQCPNTTGTQQPAAMLTPESDCTTEAAPCKRTPPPTSRHDKACQALYAMFPSQRDVTSLATCSGAPYFVVSLFTSFRSIIQGNMERVDDICVIPPKTSHPTVLAKRLLQCAIFMQQAPPHFDVQQLDMIKSLSQHMMDIVAVVSQHATCNDEVVGTAEGLECLILLGLWHAGAGNLRKAWLSYRRAMSLGQLMGIDRGSSRALQFVDTARPVNKRPTPEALWYRIINLDRAVSLLLGLPVGTSDNSFATEEAMRGDTQMERLEKLQTVIGARIIERNADKTSQAYSMTQSIDYDLDKAAKTMDDDWWNEPQLDPAYGPQINLGQMMHMMLQVHHFDLQILLHLPYMLRNPSENRYDYSKATCARASREVLKRYVSFRTLYSSAWACRHVDYSALVAAMTLLLSYLRQHQDPSQPTPSCGQRADDRKLIEVVCERMQHVSLVSHDKLSQESAEILMRMMPILDSIDQSMMGFTTELTANAVKCLHLNVPFLGTVNIQPTGVIPLCDGTTQPAAAAAGVAGHHQQQQQQQQRSPMAAAAGEMSQSNNIPGTTGLSSTGDMSLDLSSLDPTLMQSSDAAIHGMFMEFDTQPQDGMLEFPLTAEADDWILQGVDTTYWSLLNSM